MSFSAHYIFDTSRGADYATTMDPSVSGNYGGSVYGALSSPLIFASTTINGVTFDIGAGTVIGDISSFMLTPTVALANYGGGAFHTINGVQLQAQANLGVQYSSGSFLGPLDLTLSPDPQNYFQFATILNNAGDAIFNGTVESVIVSQNHRRP